MTNKISSLSLKWPKNKQIAHLETRYTDSKKIKADLKMQCTKLSFAFKFMFTIIDVSDFEEFFRLRNF